MSGLPRMPRRVALGMIGLATSAPVWASASASTGTWLETTPTAQGRKRSVPGFTALPADLFAVDATIRIDQPAQTIDGFGGAFSERGWLALSALPEAKRWAALDALFGTSGCNFSLCRTPLGANDLSRAWYSYDETPGDFALDRFSTANDRATLIPFIKAAQQIAPGLRTWASPWSPPTWMKRNGHYAMAPAWPGQPTNGIRPDQLGKEGADAFIQEDRYLEAYARYFRRYVEDYAAAGITIDTVMPQNEFNSAQPFPSCTWSPQGLARFLPFLGREMDKVGTQVFFGTLERGNADLFAQVMADPAAANVVRGIGVQWAGKGALPMLKARFPQVRLWGSEQECGVGTNDWHYARQGWATILRYFESGASAWHYWNFAMPPGGMSGWGWPQNSLVAVDPARGSYRLTPDYWLMRHVAGSVRPGARYIPVESFFGFNDQMAFRNPDGSLVLVVSNAISTRQTVRYALSGRMLRLDLAPDSLSTIVLPPSAFR
ncbi:MAG: glycoside hydrolase family 30 protein [Novosphingobium sp.]